jgi:hypothetical protein
MTEQKMTMEQAMQIQRDHIRQWKFVLRVEIMEALEQAATRRNEIGYDGPYDVWRGCQIDAWVMNCASALAAGRSVPQ